MMTSGAGGSGATDALGFGAEPGSGTLLGTGADPGFGRPATVSTAASSRNVYQEKGPPSQIRS
jgi:hypothetical protein